MGNWFSDGWDAAGSVLGSPLGKSLTIGALSAVGFAFGGPIGAAAVGGAASFLWTGIETGDWGDAATQGLMDGALGLVGGGLMGAGLNVAKRGLLGTGKSIVKTTAIPSTFGKHWFGKGAVPHWVRGTVGAGSLTAMGNLYNNAELPSSDDPGVNLEEIPVSPIGEENRPDSMPEILMPDPTKTTKWPEDLTFSEPMQQNYQTLPGVYFDIWKSFGKDPTESSLPEERSVPGKIEGEEASGIPDYTQRVTDLEIRFQSLRASDEQVATAVERTTDLCNAGKNDIRGSVSALGKFAVVHPANSEGIATVNETTPQVTIPAAVAQETAPVFAFPADIYVADNNEDSYAFSMIEGAYGGVESIMSLYSQQFVALAAEMTPPEEEEPVTPTTTTTDTTPTNPGTPGVPTAPGLPSAPTLDTSNLKPPPAMDWDGSRDSAADPAANQAERAAQQQLEQLGREIAARPPAGMQGTAGSGLESMMLPMMMQQMMAAMAAKQQRSQASDEPRRRRRDDENPAQAPAPAPAPAVAPQTAQQGAAPPAANTQPPAGRTAAPPVTTQGPGTAGKPAGRGEGNVVYTFPDGRTQEVSAVVAQALDAAFGNAAGTDAKEAYANSKVTWTDEKEIGTRVDPHQLMTGDVGVWEDRTALLVVFGTETSGTLEAVVDGQLQPVTGPADMRDGQGEFGSFVGFFHPPGIEKTEADSGVPETPAAVSSPDQPIAVAPA